MAVYIISGKIISFMYSPKSESVTHYKEYYKCYEIKYEIIKCYDDDRQQYILHEVQSVEKSVTVSNEHIYDHKRA